MFYNINYKPDIEHVNLHEIRGGLDMADEMNEREHYTKEIKKMVDEMDIRRLKFYYTFIYKMEKERG